MILYFQNLDSGSEKLDLNGDKGAHQCSTDCGVPGDDGGFYKTYGNRQLKSWPFYLDRYQESIFNLI